MKFLKTLLYFFVLITIFILFIFVENSYGSNLNNNGNPIKIKNSVYSLKNDFYKIQKFMESPFFKFTSLSKDGRHSTIKFTSPDSNNEDGEKQNKNIENKISQLFSHFNEYYISKENTTNPFSSLETKQDISHFIPEYKGSLKPFTTLKWSSPCFKNNTGRLTLSGDGSEAKLILNAQNPKNSWCADYYFMATEFDYFIKIVFFHGTHTIKLEGLNTPDQQYDLKKNGIRIFEFEDGLAGTLEDFWNVYKALTNGHNSREITEEFMASHMNITLRSRPQPYIDIPKHLIQSGDWFGTTEFSGVDVLIMYGTGGLIGHVLVALWIDDELYLVQSDDKGIRRMKYDDYIEYMHSVKRTVMWMPLRSEYKAQFDKEKAIKYFKSVEGLPYGWHNIIYAWVDTLHNNYPPPLTYQLVSVGLFIADKLKGSAIHYSVIEGLNQRFKYYLKTSKQCENMDCVFDVLKQHNKTLGEVIELPERDEWVYSDGPSMVCDVFALNLYKAAGVFGNLTNQFQSSEFTPKDMYQLKMFDENWKKPKECQVNNDQFPYCQIGGKYYWELPGFNSLDLYPNMNEHCGCLPPNFHRFPKGC